MPKRKASAMTKSESQDAHTASQDGDIAPNSGDWERVSEAGEKEDSKIISNANAFPADEFRSRYIHDEWLDYSRGYSSSPGFQITFKASAELSKDELNACFRLIETTSRPDYEASASWGWHPKRKKREMKEPELRYLLVSKASNDSEVQGFISIMLTHDSTPRLPVLYIHEIHLGESARGLGLGAHLMQVAEDIAETIGVDKVMLTCLLTNQNAHDFYKKRGYAKDSCSPEDRITRKKVVKADYVIMSKNVKK